MRWTGIVMMVMLAGMVIVGGCTHNLTKLTGEDVYSRTSDASVSMIDVAGNQTAAYHGLAPSQIWQDEQGNRVTMPGPTGILSAPMPGGSDKMAYIISQSNTTIESIKYTPAPADGEAQFVVSGVRTNMSDPMSYHVEAIKIALPVLQAMTKEEALATVEKWKIAGEMTPTVADLLKSIITAML